MDRAMALDDYMKLDYPIELVPDREEGGFYAGHPDLPGCTAQGDTAQEAVDNLAESRRAWIETRLEDRLPIPTPEEEEFRGRISLRIPPGLHAALARGAKRRDTSLNNLLNVILSNWEGGMSVVDELKSWMQVARRPPQLIEIETKTTSTVRQLRDIPTDSYHRLPEATFELGQLVRAK
jgi:antitoxin HicB